MKFNLGNTYSPIEYEPSAEVVAAIRKDFEAIINQLLEDPDTDADLHATGPNVKIISSFLLCGQEVATTSKSACELAEEALDVVRGRDGYSPSDADRLRALASDMRAASDKILSALSDK